MIYSKIFTKYKTITFLISRNILVIVVIFLIEKPILANVDVYFQPNFYSLQYLEKDQIQIIATGLPIRSIESEWRLKLKMNFRMSP
jgi:hypothetical protein